MENHKPHLMHVIGTLEIGGEQRYLARLVQQLPNEQFRQTLVYAVPGPMIEEFPEHIEKVRFWEHKPSALNPFDWRTMKPLTCLLKEKRADLVTTHGAGITQIVPALAAKKMGIPVIHTIQRPYGNRSRTEDWIIRIPFLRKWLYEAIDCFVALGNYYREDQITRWKIDENKIFLSYIGIDLTHYAPREEDFHSVRKEFSLGEEPLLGIVARHSPEKGIPRGIQAFSLLKKYLPQGKLLLVGDGPQRPEIEKYIQQMGLTQDIILAGARRDSARLMNGCDAIMQTTYNPLNGITSIEAMACGKPVITVVENPEEEKMAADTCIEKVNGLFFRLTDGEISARKLAQLLTDPSQKQRFSQNSRKLAVERFDIHKHVQDLVSLYQDLIFARRR